MENNDIRSPMYPRCHKSDQVIRIVYGFPEPEMMEDAYKGLVKLGGCIVDENNPEWYCKRDKLGF